MCGSTRYKLNRDRGEWLRIPATQTPLVLTAIILILSPYDVRNANAFGQRVLLLSISANGTHKKVFNLAIANSHTFTTTASKVQTHNTSFPIDGHAETFTLGEPNVLSEPILHAILQLIDSVPLVETVVHQPDGSQYPLNTTTMTRFLREHQVLQGDGKTPKQQTELTLSFKPTPNMQQWIWPGDLEKIQRAFREFFAHPTPFRHARFTGEASRELLGGEFPGSSYYQQQLRELRYKIELRPLARTGAINRQSSHVHLSVTWPNELQIHLEPLANALARIAGSYASNRHLLFVTLKTNLGTLRLAPDTDYDALLPNVLRSGAAIDVSIRSVFIPHEDHDAIRRSLEGILINPSSAAAQADVVQAIQTVDNGLALRINQGLASDTKGDAPPTEQGAR